MTEINGESYVLKTKRLLRNYPAFQARQFTGDFAATDILIDLERAVALAGLTARQTEALRYIYAEDLTQARAGELMGVSQVTVRESADSAVNKIAEVYESWAWKDEIDEKGELNEKGTV